MNTTAPQVSNNLVWAILTTLFCCLPLGIVSIVYASQVNTKLAAGDVAGARDSSDKAKKWAIYSAATSVVLIVLYLIFLFALGGLGMMQQSSMS
ncbi:CD225/dispanin family protein [uncultured Xanthomonas sp.]|uniref:CD225/dispanin family protein n=1 Tax=uncultured Xanthomonas sp. TaxID=152831 RepID=UPI0025EDFE90|nr:CD225/dispanin family protein [uncultured Xanthomonas sp.]